MSVVKVATLHANVGYGLVLGVWVVEDAAAEAQGAAVAVAQDIVGAQAMVEGATAHGIGLPGSEVTADHHRLPAGLHRLLVRVVSAGLRRLPAHVASAGLHHHLPVPEASAGHHHLPAPEASAGHRRAPASGAIAGPLHSHPSAKSPLMQIMPEGLALQMLEFVGGPSVCFPECSFV